MRTIGEKLDDLLDRQTREYLDTYPIHEDDGFVDRVDKMLEDMKKEGENDRKRDYKKVSRR